MIEDHRPGARFSWLGVAARSRLVWSAVLLAAGLALGFYFSADANPESAAALRNLRSDAASLHPYARGTFESRTEVRKSNVVGVGYIQRGIDDLPAAREHFASEFVRLGYRSVGTFRGPALAEDRFCRGSYEASATTAYTEPTVIGIDFDWGDGVPCR